MKTLVLALVLASCQEYGLQDGVGHANEAPAIAVAPLELDFGGTPVETTLTRELRVHSAGEVALDVSEILLSAEGDFTLLDPVASLELPEGESATLAVGFTPRAAGEREGGLVLVNSDPLYPRLEVPLRGEGLLPGALIEPSYVYFEDFLVPCTREDAFTLHSVGSAPLHVTGLSLTGSGVSLVEPPEPPFVLEPGETRELLVSSHPAGPGRGGGELWVESDDPDRLTRATLAFDAVDTVEVTDTFVLEDADMIEILLYMDQSGSMAEDIASVRDEAARFIDVLASGEEATAWRLIVAMRDDGCHSGSMIGHTDEDPVSLLRSALSSREKGRWTEAGLTIATNAVSEEALAGCNAGFLEPGGVLVLILISDEPEQSFHSWSSYVEELLAVDPKVVINAVAGPVPGGCATAAPGTGYREATMATGGLFLDFCSDWGETLATLGEGMGALNRRFYLSQEPDPDTIRVFVDRWEYTEGWTWVEGSNAVFLGPEIPASLGSEIRLEYVLNWSC